MTATKIAKEAAISLVIALMLNAARLDDAMWAPDSQHADAEIPSRWATAPVRKAANKQKLGMSSPPRE